MILLDADIVILDRRYRGDLRFATNQTALTELARGTAPRGITQQAFLEAVGLLSFNVSPADVPFLPSLLVNLYQFEVIPDFQPNDEFACCTVGEVLFQIQRQMSVGDALQSAQIQKFGQHAQLLLTWNARHFLGKAPIPVLTPEEWLRSIGRIP